MTAFNQMFKGCEMAMNSAIILARDNQDLRDVTDQESRKRKRSTKKIAHKGSLTMEEAQNHLQVAPVAGSSSGAAGPANPTSPPRVRPQYRCSDCNTLGYRRNQCPNPNTN